MKMGPMRTIEVSRASGCSSPAQEPWQAGSSGFALYTRLAFQMDDSIERGLAKSI